MKKSIVFFLTVIFILSGCQGKRKTIESANKNDDASSINQAIWLSYSEINQLLVSENGVKEEFIKVLENCKSMGISAIYLHVRPFCDSLYPSKFFPLTEKAKRYDFDVFRYMLTECHNAGISVHAWINPYRVTLAHSDVNALPAESPVYQWYHDEDKKNDENAILYHGIYLNPASQASRKLVIDGIREILTEYPVDGIHFDDYFYPTTDADFDRKSYQTYCDGTAVPLNLSDWRRSHVDALIEGCHSAIRHQSPKCIFSVSPAASIEKNYHDLYADLEKWMKNGSIDCIIPQLYFGFEYPDEEFRFETLLKEWKSFVSPYSETELRIGLGCYKIETENAADFSEWHSQEDIIARQAKLCANDDRVKGYVLFSYQSLFSEAERNTVQREKLKEWIKSDS